MIQDASSRHISSAINAGPGDTVLIARNLTTPAWNYIHEIIGDLSAAGSMSIVAINSAAAERVLGTFNLADGQGLTLQDQSGQDNRPRFEFNPDENAVMRCVTGTFTGSLERSIRN